MYFLILVIICEWTHTHKYFRTHPSFRIDATKHSNLEISKYLVDEVHTPTHSYLDTSWLKF